MKQFDVASADQKGDITETLNEEGMDSRVEQLLEESVPLEAGRTNEVYESPEKNVLKVYSDSSLSAFMDGLYRMITGTGTYADREERMENVQRVREYEDELPLKFPDIEYVGQRSLEFEKVPGKGIDEHLEELNGFRSYDVGHRLGEALDTLQDQEISMKVFSLDNIKIDDYDLYSLDHEFWNDSSTRRSRKMEKMLMLSAAVDLQPENLENFVDGFEDAYGEVKGLERLVSVGMRRTAQEIWE